jgi:hypothetical protein
MDSQFSFSKFVNDCIGLSYKESLAKAEQQVYWAESQTRGGRRGAPKARADGANDYAAELKSLLFYLRSGTKPGSGAFQMYRPIVQSLVNSGELKLEALNDFNFSSAR